MMKTKTVLTILAASVFAAPSAFATVWQVNNNPASNADFATVQDAHDGVSVGDTLYVVGSSVNYGNLTLTKRLFVFGPGYFLGENPDTQANPASAKISTVKFDPGSEGSLLTGCEIISPVTIQANNIVFKRNAITYTGTSSLIETENNISNAIITQNYLSKSAGGTVITIGSNNLAIILSNNFVASRDAFSRCISSPVTSSLIILNNVLFGELSINNSTFHNNILRDGGFSDGSTSDVRSNLGNADQFNSENGNQSNIDMADVFTGAASTDGRWKLKAGSPATGAGVQGEDVGMFGGQDPYVLSGIPPIPTIYEFAAPATASENSGLPVTIKIKSRN